LGANSPTGKFYGQDLTLDEAYKLSELDNIRRGLDESSFEVGYSAATQDILSGYLAAQDEENSRLSLWEECGPKGQQWLTRLKEGHWVRLEYAAKELGPDYRDVLDFLVKQDLMELPHCLLGEPDYCRATMRGLVVACLGLRQRDNPTTVTVTVRVG
jgi:hypothetical protein